MSVWGFGVRGVLTCLAVLALVEFTGGRAWVKERGVSLMRCRLKAGFVSLY